MDPRKKKKMILLLILLIYYWYYYWYHPKQVSPPNAPSPIAPAPPPPTFRSTAATQFHFTSNGKTVWEHTLPTDTFTVFQDKILQVDACHGMPEGQSVLATGLPLYEYLILNPASQSTVKFKRDAPLTLQKGNVFYFKCLQGRIESLHMCPSGMTFLGQTCQPINTCTGQGDGTLFKHTHIGSKYIECKNEIGRVRDCPPHSIFNHNRCEPVHNLSQYCKLFSESFHYDSMTRIKCRNKKAYYVRCKKGTRLFNSNKCEPDTCVGLPDGSLLPLPKQKLYSFEFIPGYVTCQANKMDPPVLCSNEWDPQVSEDDLTLLPMVFDGNQCSIPTFCKNVFSEDPDLIVPRYNFAKHVKNWRFSKFLDYTVGHTCENKVRKRKHLPPGQIISKHFKMEPACGPSMPEKLLISENPSQYYDCGTQSTVDCPLSTYFNGLECIPYPKNAFFHENFPLFQFDALNEEGWIKPWDYAHDKKMDCQDPASHYIQPYNICAHPDCSHYAFLSQIPDFHVLLPFEKRAQCQYDEKEKWIQKVPVTFQYNFWEQSKVAHHDEKERCQPGQNIRTQNFIWDRTVYATCNPNQPFLFCPSTHTFELVRVDEKSNQLACEPPNEPSYVLNSPNWTLFETNEIKRIVPATDQPTFIQRSKGQPMEPLPPTGVEIGEGEKIHLFATEPVLIELRYRVTYPPNVAFHYTQDAYDMKWSSQDYSFLMKLKNFTDKPLKFPRYEPIPLADSFVKNVVMV